MRLFIGIPLSVDIRSRIERNVMVIRPQIAKGKLSASDGYHLTLKFLGETSEETLGQLKALIEETRFSISPFSLRFDGLGSFSKRGGDVLWLGISPSPELLTLQKEVELFSEKAGFPVESTAYSPHLTLGRGVRYASNLEATAMTWPQDPLREEVDRLALFQSVQIEGKLSYVPLLTKKLE